MTFETYLLSGILIILLGILVFVTLHYARSEFKNPISTDDALLNSEELLKHALEIAREHRSSYRKRNLGSLIHRLSENYKFIQNVYREVIEDAGNKLPLCPASEWLLDNYYVIEEEIKALGLSLSPELFKDLKYLDNGYLRNYPRIFSIALEMVSHQDGKIEEDKLIAFINSYQRVSYLAMPELWALSSMFAIALIEKIRRICEEILRKQREWKAVEELRGKDYNELLAISTSRIKSMESIEYSYIEHLLRFFKKEGLNLDVLKATLSEKLLENDIDIEYVINREHQEQAILQISMGNSISSLHLIKALEWNSIFEALSVVEGILSEDPSGIYPKQDFESRNYYRKKIEVLSRKLDISESRIAKTAIEYARLAQDNNNELRFTHVGYYLTGPGRATLISRFKDTSKDSSSPLGLSSKLGEGSSNKNAFSLYLTLVIVFSLALALCISCYAYFAGDSVLLGILALLFVLLPSSEIVISLINWLSSRLFSSAFLPKLELESGIGVENSTIVIVPTILPNIKRLEELISQLEVTYLANHEDNIYFALVGDYRDAETEDTPLDREIMDMGLRLTRELNLKYSKDEDIFYFFLRSRSFSPAQNRWMGWERKRGAILEFNNLIRGAEATSYTVVSGNLEPLRRIKYVITLDGDTIMTIGTAKRLIGTMAHPLNRPIFDDKLKIVKGGFGLLQPRIAVNIESSSKSLFTRLFAGNGGVDTYSVAASDLYQDLFGEGIFTGKGIYDVEMFRKTLNNTIPENSVLSHDLLEGSYLRAGLVTDLEFIDGYPEKYSSYMMRLHRWVRGDWQLIRWLSPRIKNSEGATIKNPLSPLSKWKIFDNLRRSLVNVFILLVILLGITILPGNSLIWLGFSIFTFIFPLVIGLLNYLSAKYNDFQRQKTMGNVYTGFKAGFLQTLVNFILLPYFCYTMLNAIFKTLYRVYVSGKNMLEWVTAADAEKNSKNDLGGYISRMLPSLLIVLLPAVYSIFFREDSIIAATLLLIIWGSSPFVAYFISQPDEVIEEAPREEDTRLLRRVARKTWAFYEEFAGEDNNYLPIDNYQEVPIKRTANRTSPTNIGFLLVSILSAYDFGYLSGQECQNLLDKTLSTIEKMEKWRGHLYNWYDTQSLRVLSPRYVSTVDSGNLVGYYITLREGLLEYLGGPILRSEMVDGLIDTIELLDNRADENIISINKMISQGEFNLGHWYNLLVSLKNLYGAQEDSNRRILSHINEQLRELGTLYPSWLINLEKLSEGKMEEFFDQSMLSSKLQDITLDGLISEYERIASKIEASNMLKELAKLQEFYTELRINIDNLKTRKNNILALVERIDRLAAATEFTPLYEANRGIFSIGYNVEKDKLTNSYYDLLASEARITSYIGVVRREIPTSHWFRLGRALTLVNRYRGLVSWTGTMFEYFMPPLIMKEYPNTLLSETYGTALRAQRRYGEHRNLPWGTSESGYYTFDLDLNYQYKAFGVPELGLKRGLISDMVVSPYSTILALPFEPLKSIENLKRLIGIDMEGSYGLYEAADFTPDRLNPKDKNPYVIVKSYMAHHQGMIFTALNNYLHNNIMVKRFHSNPMIRAGEFLLQEKIPLRVIITKEHKEEVRPFERVEYRETESIRKAGLFDSPNPVCHLLSNGSYTVMINNSGSGYSKRDDIFLTRWREDLASRGSGTYVFIRDLTSGRLWSSAYEPLMIKPDSYEAVFSQDKGEFIRRDGEIDTHTEICVSPEDNCEIRRITISNNSKEPRLIECTSYLELVMAPVMSDIAHPAFSNLFVRTEALRECSSLIASRRPRLEESNEIWSFHTLAAEGELSGDIEYETDRYKFLGRGRTPQNPYSLYHPLSNTVGSVLDPIMSLRGRIKLPPSKSIVLCYSSGICKNREEAILSAKKYSEAGNLNRAFELAYMRSQMETKYLNLKAADIENFDDMLTHILYLNPKRRDYREILEKNQLGQQNLWPYGISGDAPIVLVTIKDTKDIDIVIYMLKAHEYWRSKGLRSDLVILNEEEGSYLQPLRDLIMEVVYSSHGRDIIDKMGGVFMRNTSTMPMEDKVLLYEAARLVIVAELGKVGRQIKPKTQGEVLYFSQKELQDIKAKPFQEENTAPYLFYNSYGGFDLENREYVINLRDGATTPLPWSNIVCNEKFGFLITEGGSGHTWHQNSRENKLTPWTNDPVSDLPGEIIYVFDEDTGELWTITPLPIRESTPYRIRHGAGYTVFEHNSHDMEQSLTMFVPKDESIKLSLVKLKNNSSTKRRLSIYYFVRPVLGVTDQLSNMHIVSSELNNAITFENSYNKDYPGNIAFMGTSLRATDFTCDRLEFLGVYGNIASPAYILRGGGMDANFTASPQGAAVVSTQRQEQSGMQVGANFTAPSQGATEVSVKEQGFSGEVIGTNVSASSYVDGEASGQKQSLSGKGAGASSSAFSQGGIEASNQTQGQSSMQVGSNFTAPSQGATEASAKGQSLSGKGTGDNASTFPQGGEETSNQKQGQSAEGIGASFSTSSPLTVKASDQGSDNANNSINTHGYTTPQGNTNLQSDANTNSYASMQGNASSSGKGAFISKNVSNITTTMDRATSSLGIYSGRKTKLSGATGAGLDACGVLHSRIEVGAGSEISFVMLLGQEKNSDEVNTLLRKYRDVEAAEASLKEARENWQSILGTLKVTTPDQSMDIMLNNYLMYQNLACRIFARSAFYQAGGAYGFRDQLQDVLGIMHVLPELARKQIILHCEHQFLEGDVLHWWHSGAMDRGIRTRFSDDLVWLPYVTAEYIERTGDISLLREEASFLEDAPLREGEDERYGVPKTSTERGSVYEHCLRAIERALKFGEHGIPLMGSGDWNDGMNTVGNKGQGESTWLGWFLYSTLQKFSAICKIMGDVELADKYINISGEIVEHIEENAWDGEWYRRAYFDDGTPLGSSLNSECKIDSLAQSWAAISGGGRKDRVITSMGSLEDYLIDRENGMILLFTPPFDNGNLKPGYIKGYVPGVRENGGQYTHAATWVIYAYAVLGNGDRAHELFHLINPINHAKTPMECMRYKVEPYVIAADVYTTPPHTGRGGWTWYTGSASWMYQTGLEAILGFRKKGDRIELSPCIPNSWQEYSISYTYKTSRYDIRVLNPNGVSTGVKSISMDGNTLPENVIYLTDDGKVHNVEVVMG